MAAANDTIAELIKEAESVLEKLHDDVKFQERYIATLRDKLPAAVASGKPAVTTPRPIAALTDPNGQTVTLWSRVVQVLRAAKRPMRIFEIVAAIQEGGFTSQSEKGLGAAVGTAINRREDLFVRKDRGLYGLAEWEEKEGE